MITGLVASLGLMAMTAGIILAVDRIWNSVTRRNARIRQRERALFFQSLDQPPLLSTDTRH